MSGNIWKRDEPDSPCVQICVLHPTERICTGCYRSGDEIARWSEMSPQERAGITAALPARARRLARRRGGRAGRRQP